MTEARCEGPHFASGVSRIGPPRDTKLRDGWSGFLLVLPQFFMKPLIFYYIYFGLYPLSSSSLSNRWRYLSCIKRVSLPTAPVAEQEPSPEVATFGYAGSYRCLSHPVGA